MLQIAVINESTAIVDSNVQHMLPAFTQQWNQDLGQVWEVEEATFTFVPKGQAPAAGTWWWCSSTIVTKLAHSPTMI
jgi:hypothetical protein